jgi:TonB-linked SusC/RagA family outer membrane protein
MQHFGVCKKRAFGIPMPLPGLLNDKYRQAVRIMKITAFILLICTLHVSAAGWSQSITLSEREAPLDKVFRSIEKQTDYIFFYNVDWVNKAEKVNVEVKDMQLQQVLDLLFKNQPLAYSVTGKMITVFPKRNETFAIKESTSTPPIDIHGKVIDENGKPVPGVTVTIKGTTKRTITDDNGEFTLRGVEVYSVVSFSSVNMEPFELSVGGQNEIIAKLKTKTSQLDDVQIIAYGQTTKRLQTGNVITVTAAEIQSQPVSNPLLALQGRVPGLFVTQTTGVPNGAVAVQIQGQNSIINGNDPLYVIDGVPYITQLLPNLGYILGNSPNSTANGNPFSFINPNDIESIEVLKDADATAIYGSRAANGAVLITTKKGKNGQTRLTLNFQNGWGKITRTMHLLNTPQYLEMRHEAINNDGSPALDSSRDFDLLLWDTTRYTDWQKTLIGGTANYTNVQASLSGGNSNLQYILSGNFHRETTVFPGNFDDKKGAVHLNLNNISSNQKFKLQFTSNYLLDVNSLFSIDLTKQAISLAPDAPPMNKEDGTLNWAPSTSGNTTWLSGNPLASLNNNFKSRTNNLVSNLNLAYVIIPGLEIKSSFGYNYIQTYETRITPLTAYDPAMWYIGNALRGATYNNNNINSWIVEPQISYRTVVGSGKLEVLAGGTIQQNNGKGEIISGAGYNSDMVLEDVTSAASISGQSFFYQYKYNALFGRVNYTLKDRYLFNFVGRRDGSSRFGPESQFHNFGSGAFAWIFSKERFLETNVSGLSFGKIRASFGTTGNDQIGDYQFLDLYSSTSSGVPYQGTNGFQITRLFNPYLQWEETKKLQFGLDLGFIKDRILLSIGYFQNRSSNQLLQYALPTTTGASSISKNLPATVQNNGWEVTLNTSNVRSKNFAWTTSVNLTIPKNKLLSFVDINKSGLGSSLIVGQPITILKLFHNLGVDPTTGAYQFADSHGNPTGSPDPMTDQTAVVNLAPKFYGGLINNVKYKNFELGFLFQFVKQTGKNYFFGNLPGTGYGIFQQPTTVLQRWQKPGDIANVQRYNSNFALYSQIRNLQNSDAIYTDASFIRLKNVSFSWWLPENMLKKIRLHDTRIYAEAQNLLTITNYKGMDPENLSTTSIPPLKVIVIGLQLSL